MPSGSGAVAFRVKQADRDRFLATGSTGHREGLRATEDELRAELSASLDRMRVAGADDAELAAALRSLAQAANRLGVVLELVDELLQPFSYKKSPAEARGGLRRSEDLCFLGRELLIG